MMSGVDIESAGPMLVVCRRAPLLETAGRPRARRHHARRNGDRGRAWRARFTAVRWKTPLVPRGTGSFLTAELPDPRRGPGPCLSLLALHCRLRLWGLRMRGADSCTHARATRAPCEEYRAAEREEGDHDDERAPVVLPVSPRGRGERLHGRISACGASLGRHWGRFRGFDRVPVGPEFARLRGPGRCPVSRARAHVAPWTRLRARRV